MGLAATLARTALTRRLSARAEAGECKKKTHQNKVVDSTPRGPRSVRKMLFLTVGRVKAGCQRTNIKKDEGWIFSLARDDVTSSAVVIVHAVLPDPELAFAGLN